MITFGTTSINEVRPNRRSRGYFRSSPLTNYSLQNHQQDGDISIMWYNIIFGYYSVDLDEVYDRCEETRESFMITTDILCQKLYTSSNVYEKSLFFYKFIHNLGVELIDFPSRIYDAIFNWLSSHNYTNVQERVIEFFDLYINERERLIISFPTLYKELEFLDNSLTLYKQILSEISGNVYFTFNEIIKNEYAKLVESNKDIFNNLVDLEEIEEASARFNVEDRLDYQSFGYNRVEVNTTSATQSLNSYIVNQSTTSTTVTQSLLNTHIGVDRGISSGGVTRVIYYNDQNEPININAQVGQTFTIINNGPRINYTNTTKKINTNRLPHIKRMKKSMKIFSKYIPRILREDFYNCKEIVIEGEKFNWSIKLRNRKDLIKYSETLNNYSISYDLWLLNNENDKIGRLCIVFDGCPILDEVLTIYMMIRTGKEIDIIMSGNFFQTSTLYNTLVKPIKEPEEKVNPYFNSLRTRDLERFNIIDRIQNRMERFMLEYLPASILNYTMNLDVSFEEAIDYEAFNLFNCQDFDSYVKRIVWSVSGQQIKLLKRN